METTAEGKTIAVEIERAKREPVETSSACPSPFLSTLSFGLRKKNTCELESLPNPFRCSGSDESCLQYFLILRKNSKLEVEEVWSYPESLDVVEERYPKMSQFVFSVSGTSYSVDELNHTFVLTDGHGVRLYGHCTTFVNGEAIVSLSLYPWCRFFTRLAMFFRCNGYDFGKELVLALFKSPTPPSGGSFHIPTNIPIAFYRPYDRLCSFIDTWPLELLTIFPDTSTLFAVLADLLLEKHIIVVGPNFGIVSHVVMSLQALIAPFDWQHILIPILPSSLLDVLAAPTPYLVGILTSQLHLLESIPIERCVMVHLGSSGTCEEVYYHSEEKHSLPNSGLFSALRIGYSTLKMRDPRDQTVRDLCSLFLSYYANLLGSILASGGKNTPFSESLLRTQCFNTLLVAVQDALGDPTHLWLDNEFIVALVRGHPTLLPVHYELLTREERDGGGFAARYENCFGSREVFTSLSAAVHGFGGHRPGTCALLAHCLRSLLGRAVPDTRRARAGRVAGALESPAVSIGRGPYHSASLDTPEVSEMVELPPPPARNGGGKGRVGMNGKGNGVTVETVYD
ncbi:Suppression of tumorigenicity 5 [Trypanosoma theileri]|uniref:Suppression of tumorigenicity 5 n=1 Tax=Trypanosoma theileri TaxID=67003 RepID=A0A1X0P6A9_9TRYP|nr:Suppression of tumorigenicity 5 [Trypanosoma theileri]ORC92173.1 Suppression of tumorigenicity 5 [Trypanosoma theileri]